MSHRISSAPRNMIVAYGEKWASSRQYLLFYGGVADIERGQWRIARKNRHPANGGVASATCRGAFVSAPAGLNNPWRCVTSLRAWRAARSNKLISINNIAKIIIIDVDRGVFQLSPTHLVSWHRAAAEIYRIAAIDEQRRRRGGVSSGIINQKWRSARRRCCQLARAAGVETMIVCRQ